MSESTRTCGNCDMVVYDIPYSGESGQGYLNPEYCPKCGDPLHDDWQECEKCGDVIDFKKVNAYAMSRNDEHAWHDDCAPNVVEVRE